MYTSLVFESSWITADLNSEYVDICKGVRDLKKKKKIFWKYLYWWGLNF